MCACAVRVWVSVDSCVVRDCWSLCMCACVGVCVCVCMCVRV